MKKYYNRSKNHISHSNNTTWCYEEVMNIRTIPETTLRNFTVATTFYAKVSYTYRSVAAIQGMIWIVKEHFSIKELYHMHILYIHMILIPWSDEGAATDFYFSVYKRSRNINIAGGHNSLLGVPMQVSLDKGQHRTKIKHSLTFV